ncbi:hypothetical protein B0I33_104523 [Prauserella shujinwangii]|uniref:Uncharacterized protein n=1 Tax=Prauserella shujinwangii TaxID=1453103 RepID=A0A2T0LXF7_9PSEU|nr:hypothetical protein B0I33_104523 [Prauserella shujinwangii]
MEQLVEQAGRFGLRAPELALVLGERAASLAEAAGANELWVRAETLVVQARVRLGHRAPTVGRAVAAMRAAEDAGRPELAAQLRTDLAVCARSVGAPLTGLAALRPVLTVTGLSAIQRATALCHLVGCLGTLGRKVELDRVLMEGDRLVSGDDSLDGDVQLLARALLRVGISAHRRRHGDLVGAADASRTGIGFLDHLDDPAADGGLARVRLVLELVCALLDRGELELAAELAQPVLDAPVRAASVAPVAWLRLAIATRVHLRNGSAEAAARVLRDAAHSAARHDLHALAARLWLELANVEERVGELADAIQCLHRARAAEHVHARARSQARALLTGEFGAGEQAPVDLAEVVAAAARSAVPARPGTAETMVLPALRLAPEPATAAGRAASGGPVVADERPSSPASAGWADEPARARRQETAAPSWTFEPPREPERSWAEWSEEPRPAEREQPTAGGRRRAPDTEDAQRGGETGTGERTASTSTTSNTSTTTSTSSSTGAGRSTRHDSEHGSVAARSVLDRLGITAGGSGGRRRAPESEEGSRSRRSAEPEWAGGGFSGGGSADYMSANYASVPSAEGGGDTGGTDRTHATHGTGVAGDSGDTRRSEPAYDTSAESGGGQPSAERRDEESGTAHDDYGWLPRLRLPPSLAPIDDFSPGSSAPAAEEDRAPDPEPPAAEPVGYGSGSYDGGQRFDDEPPPGAGLAELLARALAEHKAGTSSAAALVKQLGTQHSDYDQPRRVNGGQHNDD